MSEPIPPERPRPPTAPRHQAADTRATAHRTADADFSTFYRATVGDLAAFLLNHGATLTVAADIAQDTMIKAYQRWNEITHPRAWVHTVASRALVRHVAESCEEPVDLDHRSGGVRREREHTLLHHVHAQRRAPPGLENERCLSVPNSINAGPVAGARAHPGNGVTFGLALLGHVGFTAYLLFLHYELWEALTGSTSAVMVAAYVTRVVLTGVPPLAFTARTLVARTVLSWVKQGVAEQLPVTPEQPPAQPGSDSQQPAVRGEVIE